MPSRAGMLDARSFVNLRPRRRAAAQLTGLDGAAADLAAWRGQVVLLNFWATWCPACRTELPHLERLQAISGHDLKIAAVSTDRAGRAPVLPFVRKLGLKRLAIYLDPGQAVAQPADSSTNAPFTLYGMPITYLIDRAGWVAGYVAGQVDWSTEDARALIEALRASAE
jgi:thiol-disulfide isomerase/thioredoxin